MKLLIYFVKSIKQKFYKILLIKLSIQTEIKQQINKYLDIVLALYLPICKYI